MEISVRGRVDTMGPDGEWARIARTTDELPGGTRARLASGARLTVRNGDESTTITGPAELTIGGAAGMLASIESGRATASASAVDALLGVPGGVVSARGGAGGSQLEMRLVGGNAVVRVRRGQSDLRGTRESHALRTAETGTLTSDGTIDAESRPPPRAHIALPAGTSATLHDPQGSVAVRIEFGNACPAEGVVEVAQGRSFRRPVMRSFGTGAANILVQPGAGNYRLRCSTGGAPTGNAVAEGTLSVRRDSGRTQLPRRPSRNVVDTDGRRYTLLYQNLLPIVTVRWPSAPSATSYTLVLRAGSATSHRIPTPRPQHTLDSGEVPEGVHQLFFEADGGSPPRSPTTTLSVAYDNAASALFLREPGTRPLTGSSTAVSGIALEGWTVSVAGTELALDRQYRFQGSASLPSNVDAIAIRLVHPRHGTHYYLRRIAR
jgi:hypothetical protein